MDLSSRIGKATEVFARLGNRHPYQVLLGGLAVAALGLWSGSRLEIDPDLKALLPPEEASVSRLETLKERIGNQSDFLVEIASPDRAANIRFGQALARRMAALPEFRFVIFRRDLSFFKDNALLYLPISDLLKLRRQVIRRIRQEVARQVVEDLDDGEEAGEAREGGGAAGGKAEEDLFKYDPEELVTRHFSGAERPGEYMEADSGRILMIKARPVEQTTNVEFAVALVKKVGAIIDELAPRSYHPRLMAQVKADYSSRADSARAARTDIYSTAGLAVGLLLLVIALYFRTLRSIFVVLLPVILATIATLGLGTVIFGTFNLVTTVIFAVLLGLGIDFSIYGLSRWRFERRRGHDTAEALVISLSSTGSALLFSALTTSAVFFLLQLGEFRGFSQFGAMAGLGVLVALLSTYCMVPALITVAERIRPRAPRRAPTAEAAGAGGPPARRRAGVAAAALVLLASLGTGVLSVSRIHEIGFEYDFTKLDQRDSGAPAPPPVKEKEDYEDAVGEVTTNAPAVALCKSEQQCAEVSRLLASIRRLDDRDMAGLEAEARGEAPPAAPPGEGHGDEGGGDDPDDDDGPGDPVFQRMQAELGGHRLLPEERGRLLRLGIPRLREMRHFLQAFYSLDLFIPAHQDEKLLIIRDVRRRVDAKRALLSPETGAKVDRWHRYLELDRKVTGKDIPAWVLSQLGELDGSVGRFVVLWNQGFKADYSVAQRLYLAFFDLPAASGTVPLAANYFVLAEVINTLKKDGPVVLASSTLAVFFCLLVLFHSLRSALLVMMPLILSVSWLAGLHLLLGWKVNMFSVVAFPLLMGIGIDNGIHVFHRWRESRSLRIVAREVGGPISMASLTTVIGFGGLLASTHFGVRSLGLTAVSGIALAWFGSLVTLTAVLYLLDSRRG